MKEIYYEVTYPTEMSNIGHLSKKEVERLEKLNGGKLIIKKVEGVEYE